jgi:hypothetical protein
MIVKNPSLFLEIVPSFDRMTGAAIVRRESGGSVFMTVHGSFDGASAWALRIAMEESEAADFVIDLTYAEEAFEFAACILANWVRQHRRQRRVRVVPGAPEHARLLAGFGLDLVDEESVLPPVVLSLGDLGGGSGAGSSSVSDRAEPAGRVSGAGPATCP